MLPGSVILRCKRKMMIYVALHKIAGYTSSRGRLEGRPHPPLYSSILLKGAASPAAPFFCLTIERGVCSMLVQVCCLAMRWWTAKSCKMNRSIGVVISKRLIGPINGWQVKPAFSNVFLDNLVPDSYDSRSFSSAQ